ncbi:MAG: 2-oxo acid dehydrogenase subunit E2, partial [Fervidicoccaceae archaeon]
MNQDEEALKFMMEQYDIKEEDVRKRFGKFDRESVERYIEEVFLPKIREKRKIIGIRKTIADNLYRSYSQAVHVTLNMEVSMERLLARREELARSLEKPPSLTVMIGKAASAALKEFPTFNAT